MKKVGYFFYTFVPLLAVEAIQTIALFFMMGMGVFGQGLVGKLAFPSANVSDRLEKTFTSVNFNMMIMVIYALITIAIFGMWYYAGYEGDFLPAPKKTFNPMMLAAIVVLVPGTQFAANFIASLTGYIRPDWLQGIYAFALGIVLGYVCERGGSIYYSIGLHLLFNLWGTLSGFFPEPDNSVVVFVIVIAVTIVSLTAGFILFNKGQRKLPINSTGI